MNPIVSFMIEVRDLVREHLKDLSNGVAAPAEAFIVSRNYLGSLATPIYAGGCGLCRIDTYFEGLSKTGEPILVQCSARGKEIGNGRALQARLRERSEAIEVGLAKTFGMSRVRYVSKDERSKRPTWFIEPERALSSYSQGEIAGVVEAIVRVFAAELDATIR